MGKTMLTAAVVRDERVRRGFECIACEWNSLFSAFYIILFPYTGRAEFISGTRSNSAAKEVIPPATR